MKRGYDVRICPTCGGHLVSQEVEGGGRPALVCPQQHRFHARGPETEPPLGDPPEDIDEVAAAELIRNPRYRCHLGEQVADILRRIEEIARGLHVPRRPHDEVFRFCPRCGSEMQGCRAWDDWCLGMRCQTGHRFDYRSGLHFIEADEGTGFTLVEEMPDETVTFLSQRYTEEPPEDPQLQVFPGLTAPQKALEAMKEFLRASGGS